MSKFDVFVQVNTGESEWDDSTQDSGELIDYVAFKRAGGVGAVTEIVSDKISDKTAIGTTAGDSIRMAETVLNKDATTKTASAFLNQATVMINGTDADDFGIKRYRFAARCFMCFIFLFLTEEEERPPERILVNL